MTELPNSKFLPADRERARAAVPYAVASLVFILTIIVLADLGQHNPLFAAIRATPYGDKVCHFAFFGVFAFYTHRALGFRTWRGLGLALPLGPLLILVFATLEELSQHFFPNRTLDLVDWLADFSGIALFTWLAERGARRKLGAGSA